MAITRFAETAPYDVASGERLNKMIDEVQEEIDITNSKLNKLKIYTNISEIGLTKGVTMKEIGKAMDDNSMLFMFCRKLDYSEAPTNYGTLQVIKISQNYISYQFFASVTSSVSKIAYFAHYHTSNDFWSGWL